MKKFVFIASVIVLLIVINNLGRSIYDLLKKQDILTLAGKELENEKIENARLKRELAKADDPSFVEKEARDKLFLVQPGEAEVILPEVKKEAKGTKKELPTPQKWLKIFGF